MKFISINLPLAFAAKTISAELSCFAYNEEQEALYYIADFTIGNDNGDLNCSFEQYHLPKDSELAKLFTASIDGLGFAIDTEALLNNPSDKTMETYCDILCRLHSYIDTNMCINQTLPSVMQYMSDDDIAEKIKTEFAKEED